MVWIGHLSAAAGIGLLALIWHGRLSRGQGRHQRLRAAAIGLLALSVPLHAQATGWDRAVALALLAMMLTGAVLVSAVGWREWRSRRAAGERIRHTASARPDRARVARLTWIAVLAGPISGTAAIATSAAINRLATGLAPADRVGLATVLAPLIWAGLAVIATYNLPLLKRSLTVMGALGAALVLAWLGAQGGA